MSHEKYRRLIATAQGFRPVPPAVAHPCDESSLSGAVEAAKLGLINPILVGPRLKISQVAEQLKLDISDYEQAEASHSAAKAVA